MANKQRRTSVSKGRTPSTKQGNRQRSRSASKQVKKAATPKKVQAAPRAAAQGLLGLNDIWGATVAAQPRAQSSARKSTHQSPKPKKVAKPTRSVSKKQSPAPKKVAAPVKAPAKKVVAAAAPELGLNDIIGALTGNSSNRRASSSAHKKSASKPAKVAPKVVAKATPAPAKKVVAAVSSGDLGLHDIMGATTARSRQSSAKKAAPAKKAVAPAKRAASRSGSKKALRSRK